MMGAVTLRVPASTSNLGPGFDCLRVALRIYNEITVRHGKRRRVSAMIDGAADAFFARAEMASIPFNVTIRGDVPVSRGLGSSVTVRLGVMQGLNYLLGQPLTREEIF